MKTQTPQYFTLGVLALRRLKQEDFKFETSLGYIMRLLIKKKKDSESRALLPDHQVVDLGCGPGICISTGADLGSTRPALWETLVLVVAETSFEVIPHWGLDPREQRG